MFDLKPSVHLEEEVVAGLVVDDELDGAGRVVADRLGESKRSGAQPGLGRIGEVRCRRLFDQFLVAALHGAFTGSEFDDRAVFVADDLNLHMAGPRDVALDDDAPVAERARGFGDRLAEGMGEVGRRLGDADALPATPGGSLHEHGVPDAFRRCSEIIWLLRVREARDDRYPGFGSKAASFDLGSHGGDRAGPGPDPDQTGVEDGLGEVGVLGEKAIAGVHGVGAGVGAGG